MISKEEDPYLGHDLLEVAYDPLHTAFVYPSWKSISKASGTICHKGLRKRAPAKAPLLDASSSDTNKILNIADILLQATDLKTGQVKVFVEWDDRPTLCCFMDTPEKSQ